MKFQLAEENSGIMKFDIYSPLTTHSSQHIPEISMVTYAHTHLHLESTVNCNPADIHFYYFQFVQFFLLLTKLTCHMAYTNLN